MSYWNCSKVSNLIPKVGCLLIPCNDLACDMPDSQQPSAAIHVFRKKELGTVGFSVNTLHLESGRCVSLRDSEEMSASGSLIRPAVSGDSQIHTLKANIPNCFPQVLHDTSLLINYTIITAAL